MTERCPIYVQELRPDQRRLPPIAHKMMDGTPFHVYEYAFSHLYVGDVLQLKRTTAQPERQVMVVGQDGDYLIKVMTLEPGRPPAVFSASSLHVKRINGVIIKTLEECDVDISKGRYDPRNDGAVKR